jgi:hypothetical protein
LAPEPFFKSSGIIETMKIAATVVLFVAALFIADGMYSGGVSVGDTIKSDFLNVDSPNAAPSPEVSGDAKEQVIEGWIDTIRRRRSIRQSRFC